MDETRKVVEELQFREDYEQYLDQLEVIDDTYKGNPIIYLADVNASSSLWFSDTLLRSYGRICEYRAYKRGEKLEEVIVARQLEVSNHLEEELGALCTGRIKEQRLGLIHSSSDWENKTPSNDFYVKDVKWRYDFLLGGICQAVDDQ
uniref:Uncharacterized protein n=1 Tax=Timema bartmani TaxID=61472 RepID=A0A7R9FBF4_9NEOP|nr:unnamed protein product [Timema bartmani]